jgi:hypothetical protein
MGCLLLDTKDLVAQAKAAGRERLSRRVLAVPDMQAPTADASRWHPVRTRRSLQRCGAAAC